jgi:hypothetical protein
MKKNVCALALALASLFGCSSPETETTPPDGTVAGVRGDRYCEILIGDVEGDTVHIEVYNTYGLGDCPEAAWQALDADEIEADMMASVAILNGPRYWTMDGFVGTKVVDATVVTFGGIEMRITGELDLPLSEVIGGEPSYVPRSVMRTTTWVYEAGKPVYELVDPEGRIFDMQSYSVQKVAQTEGALAGLEAELALPAGWMFRSRVLESELQVTAVDGVATIVQDERGNTYQLSQQ